MTKLWYLNNTTVYILKLKFWQSFMDAIYCLKLKFYKCDRKYETNTILNSNHKTNRYQKFKVGLPLFVHLEVKKNDIFEF